MTTDSNSIITKILGLSQKTKMVILATSLTAAGAAPVVYTVAKEEPIKVVEVAAKDLADDAERPVPYFMNTQNEGENIVMNEDFFKPTNPSETESEIFQEPEIIKNDKKSSYLDNIMPSRIAREEQPKAASKDPQFLAASHQIPVFPNNNSFVPTPSPAIFTPNIAPVAVKKFFGIKSETRFINQEEDNQADKDTADLLMDKDYPNTIASVPYDLSRMLTTDSFIPAVMYTAINSEIPSKTVLAIVESDIVGFHGQNILIPRGSKVEGVYEALASKHARRMQITWFKITRPDGVIIKLDGESADMQGAGGLSGYLDQRLKDRYGGAILLSTINALAQMSVKENDVRQLAAVESFGREFGTLTAQIIRENINALPIIMIRQGTRFNIRPLQNIYFPKPRNKAITASFVNE